jgi:hypothetical protein
MTMEQVILLLLPVFGLSSAVAVVFWQSWRDGVLPVRKKK